MTRFVPLALALVGLAPAVAHAQSATVTDATFEEGRALLDGGRFAEACAKFKTTWDAKATPGKAFNLSACEEKQGHLVRASRWMTEGMALLEPPDERRTGAIERREGLERRAAQLTVLLGNPALTRTTVLVDGAPLDVGVRTPIDPGKHRIVAKLDGYDDEVVAIEVAEAQMKSVTLAVPHRVISKPRDAAPIARADADAAPRRTAGIVLMSVGGAALVGFGVMAGVVASKHRAFSDEPLGTQRSSDLARTGRRLEIGEGVLLGVGIAAAATGVVLVATAPSALPKRTARLVPVLDLDAQGAFGGIAGSF